MTNADKPARRKDLARAARTLKERMDARFDRLDAKTDRLAAKMVNLEAELRGVQGKVAKIDFLPTREEFLAALDGWAARFEAADRSREIRRDQWRDHERRISALERRAWPQQG